MENKSFSVYVTWTEVFLCFLIIGLNILGLFRFTLKHKNKGHHFTMLYVKLAFETAFASCKIAYNSFVLLDSFQVLTNVKYVFYSGVLIRTFMSLMGFISLFIALDRLVAMKKPIRYAQSDAKKIQKVSVTFLGTAFPALYLVYALTRHTPPKPSFMVNELYDYNVSITLHTCSMAAFLISIFISVLFLYQFKQFMDNLNDHLPRGQVSDIKLANNIVIAQIIAEFILILCPYVAEKVVMMTTGVAISAIIGPIFHPLHVLYVAFCSTAFCLISARKKKGNSVQRFTSSK
ncbi:hypothetical protein L596_015834 [Steinernema carpocapsae]|uniref:7TM GPCR serpentine receptor class x (Srx) domain-containing protein n=1 Tax=Steinernema carpocapsae TaxID=34508 RepID=A0A4U5NG80_STECR|nr:hypothetical protein L596_015834 [Steinernema carpocapsae]